MDAETANAMIGLKLKNLRKQYGLTQQELADRAELTKGFICQLENGQVSPSVVTLFDLIECLGTTPSEFFKESDHEQTVFRTDDYFEKTDDAGNVTCWVVPSAQSNQMEPILMTIQPGQKTEEDTPHNGEEFGYVLSGRVILHRGERKKEVKTGESFYFEADRSHYLENPGKRPAKLIWVSTPPSF